MQVLKRRPGSTSFPQSYPSEGYSYRALWDDLFNRPLLHSITLFDNTNPENIIQDEHIVDFALVSKKDSTGFQEETNTMIEEGQVETLYQYQLSFRYPQVGALEINYDIRDAWFRLDDDIASQYDYLWCFGEIYGFGKTPYINFVASPHANELETSTYKRYSRGYVGGDLSFYTGFQFRYTHDEDADDHDEILGHLTREDIIYGRNGELSDNRLKLKLSMRF